MSETPGQEPIITPAPGMGSEMDAATPELTEQQKAQQVVEAVPFGDAIPRDVFNKAYDITPVAKNEGGAAPLETAAPVAAAEAPDHETSIPRPEEMTMTRGQLNELIRREQESLGEEALKGAGVPEVPDVPDSGQTDKYAHLFDKNAPDVTDIEAAAVRPAVDGGIRNGRSYQAGAATQEQIDRGAANGYDLRAQDKYNPYSAAARDAAAS
ncbi:MAG TPA: hypothetical protein VG604_02015 [Candidatus Saccharimonadales bacterium]|nr:hypothetical protein [Candidatus Saccharimonadales bacterium]